jgi:hypothetical protein
MSLTVAPWHTRLGRKIGRRGTCLIVLAVMDISYGASLLAGHQPATTVAGKIWPLTVWGWIWIAIGVFLTTGIPLFHDRWHFAAAMALKATWAGLITIAWLTGAADGGAWGTAGVWLGFTAFVLLCAGWSEPAREP